MSTLTLSGKGLQKAQGSIPRSLRKALSQQPRRPSTQFCSLLSATEMGINDCLAEGPQSPRRWLGKATG